MTGATRKNGTRATLASSSSRASDPIDESAQRFRYRGEHRAISPILFSIAMINAATRSGC